MVGPRFPSLPILWGKTEVHVITTWNMPLALFIKVTLYKLFNNWWGLLREARSAVPRCLCRQYLPIMIRKKEPFPSFPFLASSLRRQPHPQCWTITVLLVVHITVQ